MRKLFYISFVSISILVAFSCKNPNNPSSVVPVISFANFTTSDNTHAVLTFNFSDGDGDIGMQQGDTAYDFYMRYYWKNYTGNFVTYYYQWPGLSDSSLIDYTIITYRIPYIDNPSKSPGLNGQIIININGYRPPAPPPYPSKYTDSLQHFRYEFYIYDRALHKSNVVTTPEFDTNYSY
ncbi:MAG: hypothetical protein ACYDCN_14835 [Bacteroidia bacterium]